MSIDLTKGKILNNREICDLFKCGPQGGMRYSTKTNTLVLVSNHINSVYQDQWIGDTFYYTGMGLSGDQTIDGNQNR